MAAGVLRQRSVNMWGWLFVFPTMTGLVILNIYPAVQTVWQSFFKAGDFGRGNVFVGFDHYVQIFKDEQVRQALINTFTYTVVEVPFSIVIAFVLAVMLNQKIAGRSFFRTLFFLPMVTAPAAVAMVWRWLYNSSFGLLNHLLKVIGMRPVMWVSDPDRAIFSIAVIGIWSCIGYNMVIFLAGLQEIPRDYFEAADIDGAGIFRKHLIVTVPLISPALYFVTVTRTITAMQVFDLIYVVMTKNNPAMFRTQSLVYLFYRYAFVENNKGYGATIIVMLLLIIMAITAMQQYIQKRWVHYE